MFYVALIYFEWTSTLEVALDAYSELDGAKIPEETEISVRFAETKKFASETCDF